MLPNGPRETHPPSQRPPTRTPLTPSAPYLLTCLSCLFFMVYSDLQDIPRLASNLSNLAITRHHLHSHVRAKQSVS